MRGIVTIEESHAHGEIKDIYSDIERTLGVPFVGSLFRALATRQEVLEAVWPQIKRNAQTQAFTDLAERLSRQSDAVAEVTFEFDDLYSWLGEHAFSREDVRQIRYALEMLHYADPRLLLATASLHVALHNSQAQRVERAKPSRRTAQEPEFPSKASRTMMEQAPVEVKEIYLDAAEAVGVPMVPDAFQMLGNWPLFLRRLWNELRPVMHSLTFLNEASGLSALAIEAAQELPYAVTLEDAGIEVRRLVDMFMASYSRTQLIISAVRWMVIEGEHLNRATGRADGEVSW
jgi:hypothetical protein